MRKEIYELTYDAEESYWWYVGRRRIVLSWLARSLARAGREGRGDLRLLDFGCGTGKNLVELGRIGAAFGVDTARDAVDFCKRRGLKNVMLVHGPDDIDASVIYGGRFDIVTMLDVLEHLADEASVLRRIRGLLNPGALLLVTVPALSWLWSGEDRVSEHHRRYTSRSLARVLRQAGYELVRISYFNTLLLPLQAAVALWSRAQGPQATPQTLVKPVPPAVNRLLTGIVSLESELLRAMRLPIGASLICSARLREDPRA